jgi:hypothetical protein
MFPVELRMCCTDKAPLHLSYYFNYTGESPNIAQVDNAVHQVQCHLRAKMIVADMDGLAPYLGAARDEQP